MSSQMHAGAIQVPYLNPATDQKQAMVGPTNMVIRRSGWLYVYLSNESNQNVYFDDLVINHKHGPVVQQTAYYPFGLEIPGLASHALGFGGNDDNRYKYNGKELQSHEFAVDGNTGSLTWEDYGERMYDPQIGRWTTVDPVPDKFYPASPFSYAVNNPVLLEDHNGEDWTITKTVDKNGNVNYDLLFTGALLNSSGNKNIDLAAFALDIQNQIESLFTGVLEKNPDGTLKFGIEARAFITVVNDVSEVADNQSLLEIKDGTDKDFKTSDGSTTIANAKTGKYIAINADQVSKMVAGQNKKTMPHETGHLAGLKHPLQDFTTVFSA